eukprot:GHVU01149115.1.p1 GENE.GHVU01149115.1~~GHVU01149115.1.p1  ORF type:complete len:410 (+),score=65.64 GHVU01149115.1:419-1648(+)
MELTKSDKSRYQEWRINVYDNYELIIEACKKLSKERQCLAVVMGGIEMGEKEGFEAVQHVHIVILGRHEISVQAMYNKLKINKAIGYDVRKYQKCKIFERFAYATKKKTKLDEDIRCAFEYMNPDAWSEFDKIKLEIKEENDKKKKLTVEELHTVRKEIALKLTSDEINEQEPLHYAFFNSSIGKQFYASMNNDAGATSDRSICKRDCKNIYPVLGQNIIIRGNAGDGKSKTAEHYLEKFYGKVDKDWYLWASTSKFMDNYKPKNHKYLFGQDWSYRNLKAVGGDGCGIDQFKAMSGGDVFTFEEKFIKRGLSRPRPILITTQYDPYMWLAQQDKAKNVSQDNDALDDRFFILSLEEFMICFNIFWNKQTGKYEELSEENMTPVLRGTREMMKRKGWGYDRISLDECVE